MTITLPQPCFIDKLIRCLYDNELLDRRDDEIIFNIESNTYISPMAIAFLATWGNIKSKEGIKFSFTGDEGVVKYLSRMNLFNCMNYEYDEDFTRRSKMGRFIPLVRIMDTDSVERAYEHVCELIVCQFDNARDFLPAADWAIYEILDNVIAHSNSEGNSYLYGQYIKNKHKICLAVYDYGEGILNSLRKRYPIFTHKSAIDYALRRGFTSREGDHLGNGLTGVRDICEINNGRFCILTGNKFFVDAKNKPFFCNVPATKGTGVIIDLDTKNPVDLQNTFIEHNDTDYIYRQVDRVENGQGLLVMDECPDFGSRETACRLRNKIEAILPDLDTNLILNFESVQSMSSSFADELVGKLYIAYGENFKNHITLSNLTDSVARRIEVVIGQRIENTPTC